MRKILFVLFLLPLLIQAQPYLNLNDNNIKFNKDTLTTNLTIDADLTVTGDLIFTPRHGFFGFQDSSFVIPGTQNNYSHITNAGNDLWQIGDPDGVTIQNDTFLIPANGHWDIVGGAGFEGSTNDRWRIAIFVNGSQVGFNMPRKTSNNDEGSFNFGGTFDLLAGDEITIEVKNIANGNDYTAVSAWIKITFLHD